MGATRTRGSGKSSWNCGTELRLAASRIFLGGIKKRAQRAAQKDGRGGKEGQEEGREGDGERGGFTMRN